MTFLTDDNSISSYCWVRISDTWVVSTLVCLVCLAWTCCCTFSATGSCCALAAGLYSWTSARIILPLGPVPLISLWLIPFSSASFLAMGEMNNLSPSLVVLTVFSSLCSCTEDSADLVETVSWVLADSIEYSLKAWTSDCSSTKIAIGFIIKIILFLVQRYQHLEVL